MEHPNVDEIVRRYKTDKDDFYDLEFEYTEIYNEVNLDIPLAVTLILSQHEISGGQGQNKLNDKA